MQPFLLCSSSSCRRRKSHGSLRSPQAWPLLDPLGVSTLCLFEALALASLAPFAASKPLPGLACRQGCPSQGAAWLLPYIVELATSWQRPRLAVLAQVPHTPDTRQGSITGCWLRFVCFLLFLIKPFVLTDTGREEGIGFLFSSHPLHPFILKCSSLTMCIFLKGWGFEIQPPPQVVTPGVGLSVDSVLWALGSPGRDWRKGGPSSVPRRGAGPGALGVDGGRGQDGAVG